MTAFFASPLWTKKNSQTETSSGDEPADDPERPNITLMLCGLSAGLSLAEMRSMRTVDVANIVAEYAAMRPQPTDTDEEEEVTVRDATDEDIDWFMRL